MARGARPAAEENVDADGQVDEADDAQAHGQAAVQRLGNDLDRRVQRNAVAGDGVVDLAVGAGAVESALQVGEPRTESSSRRRSWRPRSAGRGPECRRAGRACRAELARLAGRRLPRATRRRRRAAGTGAPAGRFKTANTKSAAVAKASSVACTRLKRLVSMGELSTSI